MGRPLCGDGLRARAFLSGRPCDSPGCAESTNPSLSFCPPPLRQPNERRQRCDRSRSTSTRLLRGRDRRGRRDPLGGRVKIKPAELELFARSLARRSGGAGGDRHRRLRSSGFIAPHVGRVVVANAADARDPPRRAKTDQLDASTLARLLAAGILPAVWVPTRRRRRCAGGLQRRSQLVARAPGPRTRSTRRCAPTSRPPAGQRSVRGGRGGWLAALELPSEPETVDRLPTPGRLPRRRGRRDRAATSPPRRSSCRGDPPADDGARGGVVTAATFVAAVGDVRRFASARKLVAYLGLDPRVRQSGEEPGGHGRISSRARRAPATRWSRRLDRGPPAGPAARLLASASAPRRPGRGGRGRAKARLPCWHLLTRGEDYAFGRPSLPRTKLRGLELTRGAAAPQACARAVGVASEASARPSGELGEQAEAAYRRLVADWRRRRRERAPARHRGAHLQGRLSGKQRGRIKPQGLRFSSSSTGARWNCCKRRCRPDST